MDNLALVLLFVILVSSAGSNSYASPANDGDSLQKICDKNANDFFKSEHGNGVIKTKDGHSEISFINHYNKQLNKCFSMTTQTNYVYINNQIEYADSFSIQLIDIGKR